MTVGELLRSQRHWGRTRARIFLSSLALNEHRELGRLTERQRNALADELEAKARLAGRESRGRRTLQEIPGDPSLPRASSRDPH
jgi:hypothetical protein